MLRRPSLLVPTFLLLALLAGCGSTVVTGASGGSTTTGTGTGGSGSGACPTAEPTGGSCAGYAEGFRCTYGDQTRAECRDEWVCGGGSWSPIQKLCAMSTACGSTQPATGTECPVEGAVCAYGDTVCLCSQCPDGPCMTPPAKWTCAGPPATPGCPAIAPNEGTPCAAEGTTCSYGFYCSGAGALAACKGGLWTWSDEVACAD